MNATRALQLFLLLVLVGPTLVIAQRFRIAPSTTEVVTPPENPGNLTYYLDDYLWLSAGYTNGYGPVEVGRSNGGPYRGDGNENLVVGGVTRDRGLGVHAPSELRYMLPVGAERFLATIGIDDEITVGGSVVFLVYEDATLKYTSATLTSASAAVPIDVALTPGGSTLRLVVTNAGDGDSNDHADWADARVTGSAPPPVVYTTLVTNRTSAGLQAAINAAAVGDRLMLAAGTWNFTSQVEVNKNDLTLLGQPGVVLDGSRTLTGWIACNAGAPCPGGDRICPVSCWYVTGQTQQGGEGEGFCRSGWDRCKKPEELFYDGTRFRHQSALNLIGSASSWWFDYDGDRIYTGSLPDGHTVKTSVVGEYGLRVTASNVRFDCGSTLVNEWTTTLNDNPTNMTFSYFASPAQKGAIGAEGGLNFIAKGCNLTNNHGAGIRIGDGAYLWGGYIAFNGQMGVGGGGNYSLAQDTQWDSNNGARYSDDFENGGAKFAGTTSMIVRRVWGRNNLGPAIWYDIDNYDALIEFNKLEDNDLNGIWYEISCSGIIRNNEVYRNGFGWGPKNHGPGSQDTWYWGSGILVAASRNLDIYNNLVKDNSDGITIINQARCEGGINGSCSAGQIDYGSFWHRCDRLVPNPRAYPYEARNVTIHDNRIKMISDGGGTGITGAIWDRGDDGDHTGNNFYNNWGNTLYNNTYCVATNVSQGYWGWDWTQYSFAGWKARGFDTSGTAVSGSCPF